jgi:hypothetical protein
VDEVEGRGVTSAQAGDEFELELPVHRGHNALGRGS